MGEILGLAPLTQVVFYTLPPPALLQANNAFMCDCSYLCVNDFLKFIVNDARFHCLMLCCTFFKKLAQHNMYTITCKKCVLLFCSR